jgi:hypothetical protein
MAMTFQGGLQPRRFAVIAAMLLSAADVRAGQQPPPIHGVTGTIATDTSIQETNDAANKVIARIGRLFGLGRTASADAAAEEALRGLRKGTRIVLQYAAPGQNAAAEQHPTQIDAEVVRVNRGDRAVSITLVGGEQQTLRLSEPGETDVANIIVYYKDRPGERVARAFKRVS